MDCMEAMADIKDKQFDLAIVDPPYGIAFHLNNNRVYKDGKIWDNEIPNPEYFKQLFRVSKDQIIWGGNYFIEYLYNTRCYLIWDKKQSDKQDNAMSELAWTSFDAVSKTFYGMRVGNHGFLKAIEPRIHPTQKPISLYMWLLQNYAKEGETILDTHGGSMSSVIACIDKGFSIDCYERDKDYFDSAVKRIKNHLSQGDMFRKEINLIIINA